MTTEDQDILAKISQLAGQINRHKSAQGDGTQSQSPPPPRAASHAGYTQSHTAWQPTRGVYNARGYGRGGRGRQAPVHRHRTLVLNGNGAVPATTSQSSPPNGESEGSQATGSPQTPAWVAKTGRHLQLINTSIYEKDAQSRAKAMEETRKQKLKQREEREKAKFSRHLQRTGGESQGGPASLANGNANNYEINVQGIRFQVAKNGSKLLKVPGEDFCGKADGRARSWSWMKGLQCTGDINAAKSTPKTALIGGVRFYRSKNGNMYRSGSIKAHRRFGLKKINEPCKTFTTTGSCLKGPTCRYVHDPRKVAVCREFVLKGSCPSGDSCDLSHELTPERTPTCLHFSRGNCSNADCRYSHVRLSPFALVCRAFGIYGYCEKGASCAERHVNECPDFSNTGRCTTKGCKLLHRHKASVMRSAISNDGKAQNYSSDISSDEEEIDDDDVDSDDLDEEIFGDDGEVDEDIPKQQDFVKLSASPRS